MGRKIKHSKRICRIELYKGIHHTCIIKDNILVNTTMELQFAMYGRSDLPRLSQLRLVGDTLLSDNVHLKIHIFGAKFMITVIFRINLLTERRDKHMYLVHILALYSIYACIKNIIWITGIS